MAVFICHLNSCALIIFSASLRRAMDLCDSFFVLANTDSTVGAQCWLLTSSPDF